MLEAREAELRNKHGLIELWVSLPCDESDCNHDEVVLEDLEPPPEIKYLSIWCYRGEKLPSWARMDKSLRPAFPRMVKITLNTWNRCQQLLAFSQLPLLKRLELVSMESVEYIESHAHDVCGVPSSSSSSSSIFFPSLEELGLYHMENLKGWWKTIVDENDTSQSALKELAAQPNKLQEHFLNYISKLWIKYCPKLRMLPFCPNLEDLSLTRPNKIHSAPSSISSSSTPFSLSGFKLTRRLESTERLGEIFATLSSSLRSLEFRDCKKLRSIAKGLEHLTNLEELTIHGCRELDDVSGGDEEGMPWKVFNTSLRSLTLTMLPKLMGLSTGLQRLSNLRTLHLIEIHELKELPEWMSCLSSLEYLNLALSTST